MGSHHYTDSHKFLNDMAYTALRKNQLNRNEIPLLTFQKKPEYIINALRKKDESFYLKKEKETRDCFKSKNEKDYPIFLYSTCYFKYINTYLRTETMYEYDQYDWFPKRYYSYDELHSWIWCLHKEICYL